ncbi:MAG: sulfatase-like hydrolase/transferase [Bacteroidia bacterium]
MQKLFQCIKLTFTFLLLFECSRIYFILYNYKEFSDQTVFKFIETAWHGFRLDLSASMYCLSLLIIVFLLEFIFRRHAPKYIYKTILIIELSLIFLITIADPELFIQWGGKFNNQVLIYVTHPWEMALSTGAVNWGKLLFFLVFYLPVVYLFYRILLKQIEKKPALGWQHLTVTIVYALFGFIALRGGVGIATISQASAIYSQKQSENAAAVNSLWNAIYYVINDASSLYGEGFKVCDTNEAKLEFENQIQNEQSSLKFSKTTRPNVLIITLESFTASASKYFSGYNNCTPELDKIAKNNLSFMRCYASGDRTDKGLLSINSGYPAQPLSSIIVYHDKVPKLPSLGLELKREGYQNSFIYGGDAEYASMASYFLVSGFDRIVDQSAFSSKTKSSKWGYHDEDMYNEAFNQINAQKEPFYSLVLSLSSHEPFDVPYDSPELKGDPKYLFKNSLKYADKCLSEFLKSCEKQAWYKNTIIILVADHGHEIGLSDKFYFAKEKYHIPLIVCGGALADNFKGKKVEHVVSQTVVPSIVLESMGLPSDKFAWQTKPTDSLGFAQYAFNNGFGRVTNHSECIYDNSGVSYYFIGPEEDKEQIKKDGRIFQQVLIDDFLIK